MSSFEQFLCLLEALILSTKGLQGINSIKDELNDAILLKFAGTDNFGTNKQGKKGEGFVRNFKSEKGKHLISGLDREIVYGCPYEGCVVLVLDGFFWVPLGRGAPFGVI
jgi:hypothetical protein